MRVSIWFLRLSHTWLRSFECGPLSLGIFLFSLGLFVFPLHLWPNLSPIFFSPVYSVLLSVFSLDLLLKEKTHFIGRILMNGWLFLFIVFIFSQETV